MDDPLLDERHERRTDLHTEIATRNHHRVGLGEHVVEDVDRLRLLDLRDHVRVRVSLLEQCLQVAHIGRRADKRERDKVHARRDRPLEIREVLAREGRDRHRHARKVHALVRADEPTDDHCAGGATTFHVLDAEPDEPVVDQHLVPGLENVPDHGRGNRQLAVGRGFLCTDADLVAFVEDDRFRELADPELRPLQVADQRHWTPDVGCDLSHEPGPCGMLLVRAV